MAPEAVTRTLRHLWTQLAKADWPVAVAGGLALSYWGSPRSTQDVDLAIATSDTNSIEDFLLVAGLQRKRKNPIDLTLFRLHQWTYDPPEQYVTVEVDLMISDSLYYQTMMSRTVSTRLDRLQSDVRVISREDLILHKLVAGRMIDRVDVQQMLTLHGRELDLDYIDSWTGPLDVVASWREATAGMAPGSDRNVC